MMSEHDNKSAPVKPKPPSERGNFPARLHGLLARDAKVGLVIRHEFMPKLVKLAPSGERPED